MRRGLSRRAISSASRPLRCRGHVDSLRFEDVGQVLRLRRAVLRDEHARAADSVRSGIAHDSMPPACGILRASSVDQQRRRCGRPAARAPRRRVRWPRPACRAPRELSRSCAMVQAPRSRSCLSSAAPSRAHAGEQDADRTAAEVLRQSSGTNTTPTGAARSRAARASARGGRAATRRDGNHRARCRHGRRRSRRHARRCAHAGRWSGSATPPCRAGSRARCAAR